MMMKRRRADIDSADHEDVSEAASARGDESNHPKRRKQYDSGRQKAKEGSSEYCRKRIRSIERLLQRNKDLPANVQDDLQRELAAHKATISDKSFQKRRSAMISKYHMVRFFERKKASRLVKQLERKIERNPEGGDAQQLRRQLHVAQVDEAYAIYHPHLEPYISLYGNSKGESKSKEEAGDGRGEASEQDTVQSAGAQAALSADKPAMWFTVESTMEQGVGALMDLRERKPGAGFQVKERPAPAKASENGSRKDLAQQRTNRTEAKTKVGYREGDKIQLNRRERRRLMREALAANNSDEDGDHGGFFEEL